MWNIIQLPLDGTHGVNIELKPCRECFWELIGLLKTVIGVFSLPLCLSLSLSFGVYDEAVVIPLSRQTGLPPSHSLLPAALFLQGCLCLWRLPLVSSVLGPRAKGWHWNLCFSGTARMRVRNWGCWVQHLTLLSRPFILRGTSSEEMELKVKIPFFVLAAEAQLSSFLSYCLTLCLCLCYRNRANSLCVQVFCSLQLLNGNRVRFEACTGISSVPVSFGAPCQVEVVCLPSCSDCLP